LAVLLATLLLPAAPTHAGPARQDDPTAQCAEGVRLVNQGQPAEALPLLAAGFAGREHATFDNPADLMNCAMSLGTQLLRSADPLDAMEPLGVALELARDLGDIEARVVALYGIAGAYSSRFRYAESDTYYQQALDLARAEARPDLELWVLHTWIGSMLAQQRFDTAQEYIDQAVDLSRQLEAPAYTAALMIQQGDVDTNQQEIDRALTAYEAARDLYLQIDNPQGAAQALQKIGQIQAVQGNISAARATYESAIEQLRQTEDSVNLVLTSFRLVQLEQAQGLHEAALTRLAALRPIIANDLAPAIREQAETNVLMLTVQSLQTLGRLPEAFAAVEHLRDLARALELRTMEVTALNTMGQIHRTAGRLETSLATHQQAAQLARDANLSIDLGETLNYIANIYGRQGRYDEALGALEEARTLLRDHSLEVVTLMNTGTLHTRRNDLEAARAAYQEALAVPGDGDSRLDFEGEVRGALANIDRMQGRYDEALEHGARGLSRAREQGDPVLIGSALNMVGLIHSDMGNSDQAMAYYEEALIQTRKAGNRLQEITILSNLGFEHQEQDRPAEALHSFVASLDLLEEVRAAAGNEEARMGIATSYTYEYAQAVQLAHQQGQDELAFSLSERGRARAFLDSLATGEIQLADTEANELLERERGAYAGRQTARDAFARARIQTPGDAALLADLEAQLQRAETAYAQVLEEIAAFSEQEAAALETLIANRREAVLSVDELQEQIDADTTLVSYFVGAEATLAFVVTRDALQVETLPVGRDALQTEVQALRAFDFIDETETHPAPAITLYQHLIAPLEPHLTTSHLTIVPHGVLHYLPFAALSDGERFLVDAYTLTRLPAASARAFLNLEATAAPEDAVLVLANPDGPPVVPGVAEAAQTIAGLFGVTPFLQDAATEETLHTHAGQSRIVHLGAHGTFDSKNPLNSYLQLQPDAANDGQLTVAEVYGLDLAQADLVVLSACETLVDQRTNPDDPLAVTAGDDLVGLTRAFFFAGTPTVVATLWQVEDAPSRLLMERFYAYLRHGTDKATALRQAQRDVRRIYPHPYHWAGFVLTGDGGVSATDASEASEYDATLTPTSTPSPVATATPTPTPPPSATATPSAQLTATRTPRPRATDTRTPRPRATDTRTPQLTATATPTPPPSLTALPTSTHTMLPTATLTATPTGSITVTPPTQPTGTPTAGAVITATVPAVAAVPAGTPTTPVATATGRPTTPTEALPAPTSPPPPPAPSATISPATGQSAPPPTTMTDSVPGTATPSAPTGTPAALPTRPLTLDAIPTFDPARYPSLEPEKTGTSIIDAGRPLTRWFWMGGTGLLLLFITGRVRRWHRRRTHTVPRDQ
jgi:CHAT domain-containing protein/tetratricopeptide (TPR) repeat protein